MLCPIGAAAADDALALDQSDRKLHAIASYAITTSALYILTENKAKYPLLKSMALGLGVGIAKELVDSQFSTGDIKADLVGILASGGLYLVLHF